MANQANDIQRERLTARKEVLVAHPVQGGAGLYIGALAAVGAAGLLEPATDTAGLQVAGVVWQGLDNSTGADGQWQPLERSAVVETDGQWAFARPVLDAEPTHGAIAYLVDDQTVSPTAGATTQAHAVGRFVRPSLQDPEMWIVDLLKK